MFATIKFLLKLRIYSLVLVGGGGGKYELEKIRY